MINELKSKSLLAHQAIEQLQADSKNLVKQWEKALRNGEDDKSVTAIESLQLLNKREIVRAIARAEAADMEIRKAQAQAEAIAGKKAADEFVEADRETRKLIADVDAIALLYIAAVQKLGNADLTHPRERARVKSKQSGTLPFTEQLSMPNQEIFLSARRAVRIVEFLNSRAVNI